MVEIEDIEASNISWFQGKTGFSLNIQKNEFVIYFLRERGLAQAEKWDYEIFKIDDVRNFNKTLGVATEYTTTGSYAGLSGGARQMGEGIGLAARNALEAAKAKRRMGIEFELRSTQRPKFFVQVTDEAKQDQIFEGVRQLLQDGRIDQKLLNIPDGVRSSFPTEAMLEKKRSKLH